MSLRSRVLAMSLGAGCILGRFVGSAREGARTPGAPDERAAPGAASESAPGDQVDAFVRSLDALNANAQRLVMAQDVSCAVVTGSGDAEASRCVRRSIRELEDASRALHAAVARIKRL